MISRAPSFLALVTLAGVALSACQAKPAPATAAAPKPASEVAATLDGAPITLADLDERAETGLVRVRQQEYELRKEALDALIGERLLEKEAKSRGIAVEQLLKDEVDRQIAAPDPAQIALVYEQNRARFGSRPRAEVEAEIAKVFVDRARAGYRETLTNRLREKAQVAVSLAAPRSAVVSPTSAPTLGPEGAQITIVSFADFQCPYCQRAQSVIDQVMKAYDGKVQLVHRDFPLDGHPQAFVAARAARCAGEQGRYWEYHRSLMMDRGDMSETDLQKRATGLKLSLSPFNACIASDRHDVAIKEGLEAGMRLGVNSTPTFFVNGQMLVGARPFEDFKAIIEGELKKRAS